MPHYFVQEILDIVNCEVEHFDAVALATAMHRLSFMPMAPNQHDQIIRSSTRSSAVPAVADQDQGASGRDGDARPGHRGVGPGADLLPP